VVLIIAFGGIPLIGQKATKLGKGGKVFSACGAIEWFKASVFLLSLRFSLHFSALCADVERHVSAGHEKMVR